MPARRTTGWEWVSELIIIITVTRHTTTTMAEERVIERRTVLIVGKTGTGKSTLANHILKANKFPVSSSVQSEGTRISHAEAERLLEGNTRLTIKVIDTRGLFENAAQVSNKDVIKEVKLHCKANLIQGVNLILFVFRKGKYTKEEREAFQAVIKEFGKDIQNVSALIITNCESLNENKREEIKQDFLTNPLTSGIGKFMGKGIHTVGFPIIDDAPEVFQNYLQAIAVADEESLAQLIIGCKERIFTEDMKSESFWERCIIL